MRTYAEYLTSLTVKTLNAIAKQGGYKGYSKLRKAELVAFIDGEVTIDHDGATAVKILDVTVEADQPEIREIMATVAPVTFSETPVKAAESAPEATEADEAEETTLDDLLYYYRAMRRTIRDMGNTPRRVKIVMRMRVVLAQIKATGYNLRTV
jgi:hypothetical protein